MDRSISSLSSFDGETSLSASRILELESQTSALGHVGLLKWQRNDLNKKLRQQQDLTAAERKNATNARKLALRLAAQIAVKEAKLKSHSEALANAHGSNYVTARKNDAVIKDLEVKLQDDLTRANGLLRTLGGAESSARYDGVGFHLARPLSPPLSPFSGKEPFGRRHRSPSAQKLPSEILQICQLRAETLLRECNDQQDSIHQLQQTEASLRWTIHEKTTEISRLSEAKDAVEQRLAHAKNDIARLEADAEVNSASIEGLEIGKRALESQLLQLETEAAELQKSHDEKEHELVAARQSLEDLQRESQQTSENLANAETRLSDLNAKKEESHEQILRLKEQLSRLEHDNSERTTELERRIEDLRAEITTQLTKIESHENAAKELRGQQHDLEQAKAELRKNLDQLHQQKVEGDQASAARLKEAESRISTLEADIATLEKAKEALDDANGDLRHRLNKAEQALSDARGQAVATVKEHDAASEAASDHIKVLEKERLDLQQQITELEERYQYENATVHALRADVKRAEAQRDEAGREADSHAARISVLAEQVRSYQDRIAQLETEAGEEAKLAKDLKSQIEQFSSERDEANDAHKASQARVGELDSHLHESRHKIDHLEAALAKEQEVIAGLRTELQATTTQCDSAGENIKTLEIQKEDAVRIHREQMTKLEDSLDSLRGQISSLESKVAEHVQSKDGLQNDLREARASRESLENDFDGLQRKHQDIQDENAARLAEADSRIAELNDKISGLQSDKSALTGTEQKLRDQLQDLQKSRDLLAREHEVLQTEHNEHVEKAQRRASDLQLQIDDLQSSLSSMQTTQETQQATQKRLECSVHDMSLELRKHKAKSTELQSELERARGSLSKAEEALSAEQQKVKELEAARNELQSQVVNHEKRASVSSNVIKSLREQLSEAQSTITALEKGKGHADAELTRFRSELTAAHEIEQQLRVQVTELEKNIVEHQTSATTLRSMLKRARHAEASSSKTVLDLSTELDGVNEKLLQTRAQYTECAMKLAESEKLRKEADLELASVKKAHTEAIETLDSEQKRSQSLSSQIGDEKKASDSIRELLAGVQHNLDSTKSEHSKLQASRIALEAELNESQSQKSELAGRLDEELRKCESLMEQLTSTSSSQSSLQTELQALRAESQKADCEMSQLRTSLAEALDSSNMYDLSSKAAEQKVDDLTKQLSSLEAKIGQLQALERENLQKSNANQNTIVSLEEQLSHSQEASGTFEKELQAQTTRVASLEDFKTKLESELRDSRLEIQSLRDINQTLQQELSDAHQQLRSLEQKYTELQGELDTVQASKSDLESTNARLTQDILEKTEYAEKSQTEKAALEDRLKASETTIENLHKEIKQLTNETREAHSQLRKSQAVRVSHENALGSIRIRLGASKMAKRGIQIKLTQAEKDLSTLTTQKERLEATLQNALSDVVEGRSLSSEQKRKIIELQDRNDRMRQRIESSEENAQLLRDTVRQFEQESVDYKQEIARLKGVVDQAQVEISSLKDQVTNLTEQRARDQDALRARRKSIQDVQQAKVDLEKALSEKVSQLESEQGRNNRLQEQAIADQQTIERLEEEKADLSQQTRTLQQKLDSHPADQRERIGKLERELEEARQSAQMLRSRLRDQEKQNGYLRQQHEQYEREVPMLRDQLSELRASRTSQESRIRIQDRPSENAQPDRRSIRSDEVVSTYASSPTLVTHELEPPIEEDEREEYFDVRPPSARPMSRAGTGRSSLKAFRVLGAEAAQARLGRDVDDDIKKELWEMWSSQHKLNSWHEDDEKNLSQKDDDHRPLTSHLTPPRLRRKLTKKKKIEELKPGEHGKFYNLMHYGSVSRPQFERASTPGAGRSFSSKH